MDWQGQKLAEQIMQYALLAAAVIAFMAGYIMSSFQLMIQVYGALVLVVLLVVVPDWSFFNKHPLEWLEPQIFAQSTPKGKSLAPTKKPAKTSKK